jgi:hypothetical protein
MCIIFLFDPQAIRFMTIDVLSDGIFTISDNSQIPGLVTLIPTTPLLCCRVFERLISNIFDKT